MIKGQTALSVWIAFFNEEGREPSLDEFKEIGYCKSTFYKTKRDWEKWLIKKEMERRDNNERRFRV